MAYASLARKYRPATFSTMLGQGSLVQALTNAIRLERKPQSVIFSGVRGVGKTTAARLYAKALNCQTETEDLPCNTCESCLAINQGIHEDVLEIDGASHTGVDDVRAIQESMGYVPQRSRYKIYIIDEVHMLSQSAFNALLKTLEEPPAHVVFLFATTELRKVPTTILSRCQTYHLQLIPFTVVVARIEEILVQENISFEKPAIELIAREGRGSMRDSLTLLDQAIALTGGSLTTESVRGMLGISSTGSHLRFLRALVTKDAKEAVVVIGDWDQTGISLREAVEETCQLARHAFVVRDLGAEALETAFLGLDKAALKELAEIASAAKDFDLNRIFRTLAKCRGDLDGANLDRYILENYVFEWCFDPGFPDFTEILHGGRLASSPLPAIEPAVKSAPVSTAAPTGKPKNLREEWQKTLQKDSAVPAPAPVTPPAATAPKQEVVESASVAPQSSAKEAPIEAPLPEKNFPASWRELVDRWKEMKPLQGRVFEETYAFVYNADKIDLGVDPTSLAGGKLLQKEVQSRVLRQLQELFGFSGQLVIRPHQREDVVAIEADQSQETLLDVKRREKDEARQKLREEIEQDPITQEALSALKGKIGSIEFQ